MVCAAVALLLILLGKRMSCSHGCGTFNVNFSRGCLGQAADLEDKLREKELEVERLRMALAKAGVDQSAVAGPEKVRCWHAGPLVKVHCRSALVAGQHRTYETVT